MSQRLTLEQTREKREAAKKSVPPSTPIKLEQAKSKREAAKKTVSPKAPMTLEQAREKREAAKKPAPARAPITLNQAKSQREAKMKPSAVPNLVGNQYFRVYFGATPMNFIRVSNVQRSTGYDELTEGGLNGYVHILTKPGGQTGTLTFEKGIVANEETKKLMKALAPGVRITVPVTVTLCYQAGDEWKPVRSWQIEDGLVTRWEIGTLDGLGSEVTIEKLEITHSGLKELEA